jgi:hypothetical protein
MLETPTGQSKQAERRKGKRLGRRYTSRRGLPIAVAVRSIVRAQPRGAAHTSPFAPARAVAVMSQTRKFAAVFMRSIIPLSSKNTWRWSQLKHEKVPNAQQTEGPKWGFLS